MNIFIIGNGESRKDFDLNYLRGKGVIVGCNAIYRDFKPHVLVSLDDAMIKEIRNNCNFFEDIIWVWRKRNKEKPRIELHIQNYVKKETIKGKEILVYQDKAFMDQGWASGPTCLYAMFSILIPYHFFIRRVYLIGFDLARLSDGKGNSMYKGTDCYIPIGSDGSTHDASTRQLKKGFDMYKGLKFFRVLDDPKPIQHWKDVSNIKHITYERFYNDTK